ncbi:MAG: hypothetical protein JWR69_4341 [Pedosphaera sp.]|nr:hypothetical protein [Pedosphaera sp.]
MKTIRLLSAAVLLLLVAGCSTPKKVAHMQGQGTREVYDANYDRVWSAAVAAAQTGDLYILNANKQTGFISARRGIRPETFGENVGIWVHGLNPSQTEVEVVSRQTGPPVLVMRNWEHRILANIGATLTT